MEGEEIKCATSARCTHTKKKKTKTKTNNQQQPPTLKKKTPQPPLLVQGTHSHSGQQHNENGTLPDERKPLASHFSLPVLALLKIVWNTSSIPKKKNQIQKIFPKGSKAKQKQKTKHLWLQGLAARGAESTYRNVLKN